MSETSTRVWLNDRLWDEVRNRALAEGITVRELIPRLVGQGLTAAPGPAGPLMAAPAARPSAPAAAPPIAPAPVAAPAAVVGPPAEPGPPVVVLSEVYRCDVCGADVRLGGLSNHMGKHLKERQASEAERS